MEWANDPASTIAGMELSVNFQHIEHMWITQAWTGTPTIAVTAAGDRIGLVETPIFGTLVMPQTEPTRPTLRTAGAITYAEFDGSDDRMIVDTSPDHFHYFFELGTGFAAFKVRFKAAQRDSRCFMFDSANGTGANPGVLCKHDPGNTLTCTADHGAPELPVWDDTTSFTFDDDTWYVVIWNVGPAAAGEMILAIPGDYAGRTVEAITRDRAPEAEGTGTPSELFIGSRRDGTQLCEMDLSWIKMGSQALDQTEIQALVEYEPALTTDTLLDIAGGQSACYMNFTSHCYDLSPAASAFHFQDRTQRATSVGDGDPIGTVANKLDVLVGVGDPFGHLDYDAFAVTDSQRCLWQSDGTGCLFTGSDQQGWDMQDPGAGGNATWIVIYRNTDAVFGSRPLTDTGSVYMAITGNEDPQRVVTHPASGDTGSTDLGNQAGGYNIIVHERVGDTWHTSTRGDGNTVLDTSPTINVSKQMFGGMCNAGLDDWDCEGELLYVQRIAATMTNAQVVALMATLATDFGQSL